MTTQNNISLFNQTISNIDVRLKTVMMSSLLCHIRPVIIAVAKQQPVEKIEEALRTGHRHFGENRVQEALSRWLDLKKSNPDIYLHLIGPLQSNKVAEAVGLFDSIHSIDRIKIADAVRHESLRQQRQPECLIQVNTGEEAQKSGVLPGEFLSLLDHCRNIGLKISGLMCVPPVDENPAPHFALLHAMAKQQGLKELSMGMSGDYELAAHFGATYVRIGTALFGERQSA